MSKYLPFGKEIKQTEEQIKAQKIRLEKFEFYGIPYGSLDGFGDENQSSKVDQDRSVARLLILQEREIPKELEERLLKYKHQEETRGMINIEILTRIDSSSYKDNTIVKLDLEDRVTLVTEFDTGIGSLHDIFVAFMNDTVENKLCDYIIGAAEDDFVVCSTGAMVAHTVMQSNKIIIVDNYAKYKPKYKDELLKSIANQDNNNIWIIMIKDEESQKEIQEKIQSPVAIKKLHRKISSIYNIYSLEEKDIKRYLIRMENCGFEFQTKYFINTKEFWDELAHADYFRIGEGIYVPLSERNIKSIEFIN